MSSMIFKRKTIGGTSFQIILIVLIRPGSKSNGLMLISKAKMSLCLKLLLKIKVTIMATNMQTTMVMVTVKATLAIVVLITTISPKL